jgi:hypothetical protein
LFWDWSGRSDAPVIRRDCVRFGKVISVVSSQRRTGAVPSHSPLPPNCTITTAAISPSPGRSSRAIIDNIVIQTQLTFAFLKQLLGRSPPLRHFEEVDKLVDRSLLSMQHCVFEAQEQ